VVNNVMKLLLFSLILNFAVGIMSNIIPVFDEYNALGGYNSDYDDDLIISTNTSINPSGTIATDASDQFDQTLDNTALGMFGQLTAIINTYMFGFVVFLEKLFNIPTAIGVIMRSIISSAYVLFTVWLFTGKNVVGEGR